MSCFALHFCCCTCCRGAVCLHACNRCALMSDCCQLNTRVLHQLLHQAPDDMVCKPACLTARLLKLQLHTSAALHVQCRHSTGSCRGLRSQGGSHTFRYSRSTLRPWDSSP
jgi:hypothetical protein